VYDGHDNDGGAGIEPGRRFVEKQDRRRLNQLHADVDAFPLSARHAANKLVADLNTTDCDIHRSTRLQRVSAQSPQNPHTPTWVHHSPHTHTHDNRHTNDSPAVKPFCVAHDWDQHTDRQTNNATDTATTIDHIIIIIIIIIDILKVA